MAKQNDIAVKDQNIRRLPPTVLENLFNVYSDTDGVYYYNLLKTVYFPDDLNPLIYTEYETKPNDTWPLISWKFYQDIRLWWVIVVANNIENPVSVPKPGTIIKIISSTIVRDLLTEIESE